MSTISAGTTSTATLIHSGDTTGSLVFKTNDTGSGGTTAVTIGTDQSFNFSATGQRITGDFSNATIASRVAFQTSTANSATSIYILPNGTSPTSQFVAVNNSDPTNASVLQLQVNATDYQIRGGLTGTGSYLPMTFYTGGSERIRIDSSGNVGIGTDSPTSRLTINSPVGGTQSLLVRGESNTERAVIQASGASGGTAVFNASSSRGTTASPAVVQSGDALGYYQFGGYDGSAFNRSAWILGLAAENYSVTNRGAHLTFSTTPIGSTTIAERMRIDSSGNVGINSTTPAQYATSGKVLNITGTANNNGPAVQVMSGSSTNPGAGNYIREVFALASIPNTATEITRITGTGSNGMSMYIRVTATGHTASVGNGSNYKGVRYDGGTTAVTQVETATSGSVPTITFDTATTDILIIKLAATGVGGLNGVMVVEWFVPIDFGSNTWVVS